MNEKLDDSFVFAHLNVNSNLGEIAQEDIDIPQYLLLNCRRNYAQAVLQCFVPSLFTIFPLSLGTKFCLLFTERQSCNLERNFTREGNPWGHLLSGYYH